MDLNTVSIVGRFGKDPELRQTPGGDPLCSFSLAVSSFKLVNEEWKEDTSWFDIAVWGKQAEKIAGRCKKGHRLGVTGSLKQRTWEAEDGTKREKVSIVGRQIMFLEKKPKTTEPTEVAEPAETRPYVAF